MVAGGYNLISLLLLFSFSQLCIYGEEISVLGLTFDVIIVGSGISGLVAAKSLKSAGVNTLVLEGLSRVGGRTYAPHSFDLGAAWSWPAHDVNLATLLKDLNIPTIPQAKRGEALFENREGRVVKQGRNRSPSGTGSVRIKNGTGSICPTIVEKYGIHVKFNSRVSIVDYTAAETVMVSVLSGKSYRAKRVIIAVPPQSIARHITFSPLLNKSVLSALLGTPTWMANAGKVCLHFAKRFWKRRGLSGTAFSQRGPIAQAWDSSDATQQKWGLCGFVFDRDLRHLRSEAALLSSPIMPQLERIYGRKVRNYTRIEFKEWSPWEVKGSSAMSQETSARFEFGHPLLRGDVQGKIFFASTETVPNENGHMEGAVLGGLRASAVVRRSLSTPRSQPKIGL